ncbi:MAG TPA: hypothetical protein VGJ28_06360, partial [Micromonosporaceae bacterium]
MIDVPDGGGNGVIVAQGGTFGGWCFYLHEGQLRYCSNLLGLKRFTATSQASVPAGSHEVAAAF